ncbi:MAG: Rab family GTPase [Promethearchaeia archaeon]
MEKGARGFLKKPFKIQDLRNRIEKIKKVKINDKDLNKMKNYDYRKIAVVGNGAVGKTSFLKKYIQTTFDEDSPMTKGVEFFSKEVNIPKNEGKELQQKVLRLLFFDFAGQERWRCFQSDLLMGSAAALLFIDLTRYQSLEDINKWITFLRAENEKIPILLIGNKSDLNDRITISDEKVRKIVQKHKLSGYIKTSAKNGHNAEKIFQSLRMMLGQQFSMIYESISAPTTIPNTRQKFLG